MKKLIIPFLSAVILLSSCSQALYKNKYNWVKAEPRPATDTSGTSVAVPSATDAVPLTGTDTLTEDSALTVASLSEEQVKLCSEISHSSLSENTKKRSAPETASEKPKKKKQKKNQTYYGPDYEKKGEGQGRTILKTLGVLIVFAGLAYLCSTGAVATAALVIGLGVVLGIVIAGVLIALAISFCLNLLFDLIGGNY